MLVQQGGYPCHVVLAQRYRWVTPIVTPTGIGGGIVTTIEDCLQVEHDIGVCIGQGDADTWQALPQCYSPDLIAVALATAVQAH